MILDGFLTKKITILENFNTKKILFSHNLYYVLHFNPSDYSRNGQDTISYIHGLPDETWPETSPEDPMSLIDKVHTEYLTNHTFGNNLHCGAFNFSHYLLISDFNENSRSREFSTRVSSIFSRSTTRNDFLKSRSRLET